MKMNTTLIKKICLTIAACMIIAAPPVFTAGCGGRDCAYSGSIDLSQHPWLQGRKIFIDPGHGGLGAADPLRVGPGGITEESVNLRVSLILSDMLRKAGAAVTESRTGDVDVSLDDRVRMVQRSQPELLVSIHHNGSPRRVDSVNYPSVLIWGSRLVRPASYDFGTYLQKELHKIMDERGVILSDHSVFSEDGTRILRETRYICPGVIGEAGFFSHRDHAVRLNDLLYNQREAEAYFTAISLYFKRGVPTAEVHFSCPVDNSGYLMNMISDKKPVITIRTKSGNEVERINERSLKITLDGLPVGFKKISDNVFSVNYGPLLYPGGHRLQFQFKNLRDQSSMILCAPFTVEIEAGDHARLIKRGRELLWSRRSVREGLKMLLAALSMGQTDPGDDALLMEISRGFMLLGDRAGERYYLQKLFYFYPESRYGRTAGHSILSSQGYRHLMDYHGKAVNITGHFSSPEKPGVNNEKKSTLVDLLKEFQRKQ